MLSIPNDSLEQKSQGLHRLLWPFGFCHWCRRRASNDKIKAKKATTTATRAIAIDLQLMSTTSHCVFIYFMHNTIIILITLVNRFICSEYPQKTLKHLYDRICNHSIYEYATSTFVHCDYNVLFRWFTNSMYILQLFAQYTVCTFKSPWTAKNERNDYYGLSISIFFPLTMQNRNGWKKAAIFVQIQFKMVVFAPFKMAFVVMGHYHWLNNDFNFCNLFDLWPGNKIDH